MAPPKALGGSVCVVYFSHPTPGFDIFLVLSCLWAGNTHSSDFCQGKAYKHIYARFGLSHSKLSQSHATTHVLEFVLGPLRKKRAAIEHGSKVKPVQL